MANSTYTVQNFYRNIAQNIPMLLQYQFLVTIIPGNGVYGDDVNKGVDFDKIQILTQAANIPRNTIGTADINYFGKSFSVPTTTQTQNQHEWKTNIILTNDMKEYNQLRNLMLKFSSLERNMGGIRTVPNLDIIVDVLDQFSQINKSQPRVILKGAFPTNLQEVRLEYKEQADVIKPEVTFTYQYSYFDMAHDRNMTDSLNPGNVAPLAT